MGRIRIERGLVPGCTTTLLFTIMASIDWKDNVVLSIDSHEPHVVRRQGLTLSALRGTVILRISSVLAAAYEGSVTRKNKGPRSERPCVHGE